MTTKNPTTPPGGLSVALPIGIFFFILASLFIYTQVTHTSNPGKLSNPPEATTSRLEPGRLTISYDKSTPEKTVRYGTKNVKIMSLSLRADPTEDIEIRRVALEFFAASRGQLLDKHAIQNLRLIDDAGSVYAKSDELLHLQEDQKPPYWGKHTTTYALFSGKTVVKAGQEKKLDLAFDVPVDSKLEGINAFIFNIEGTSSLSSIKAMPHIVALGVKSKKTPYMYGEVFSGINFKPADDIGSITLDSDGAFRPVYPRISKSIQLSKFYLTASEEEDVLVSKIALRISNYIPGQYSNIKLVDQNNTQYGRTIVNPEVIDANFPNAIFHGNTRIQANTTQTFELIGDVSIPSAQKSQYGTQLQREINTLLISPENHARWIDAKGANSQKDVHVAGGIGTWLEFTE